MAVSKLLHIVVNYILIKRDTLRVIENPDPQKAVKDHKTTGTDVL